MFALANLLSKVTSYNFVRQREQRGVQLDNANIVGKQVKYLRKKQGLTQAQFVARCHLSGFDISRESLAKLETGRRQVIDKEILILANLFKVEIKQLFGLE